MSYVEKLRALRGSIKKWEKIVSGKGKDEGTRNCPLCQLFLIHGNRIPCRGCPVFEKVKTSYCERTPYIEWQHTEKLAHSRVRDFGKADTPKLKKLAKAELDFLRSLLPAKSYAK